MNYGRSVAVIKEAAICRAAGMDEKHAVKTVLSHYLPDDRDEIKDFLATHFATIEIVARKIPLVVDGLVRKEF